MDDNPLNLKLIRIVLAGAGYDVVTAADADEARAELARARPRLVLMDIQLPGTDGLALTREIRAAPATANLPVIAVTFFAMYGDERRALEAGCSGYVTKPIDIHRLPTVVAGHLNWKAP